MLYSGGYFCQVIEEPKSNVDTLLEKILADSRNGDIIILSNEAISRRMFSDWYMAFAGTEENPLVIQGIVACKNEMNLRPRGHNLMSGLEQLVVNKELLMGNKKKS